jgi:MFS family permease
MATNGVLIIVAQPFVLRWLEARDRERVLVGASLLYGVGMLMHGLAPAVIVHIAAVVIWTTAEVIESPVRSAMVAQMAPSDARGRYQGAFVMTWGAAALVSPRLGTQLWEDVSPIAPWIGCFVLAVFVAVAFALTARMRR